MDQDEVDEPYPDWWRRNVEEFREHDLPPYRPPRFSDGELVPPVVESLEAELGATIQLRVVDPQAGNDWEVLVDGVPVGTFERRRHEEGYPVLRLSSSAFAELVRDAGG